MFFKLYAIALPILFIIDMIWLGFVAKGFYSKHIGFMLRSDVNWMAAVAFYLLFIVGLIVFVVMPAMEKGSWSYALLYGLLFGVVTYATYDLTNLALVKDWPPIVTVVDLLWGAFLASSVSTITVLIAQKLGL